MAQALGTAYTLTQYNEVLVALTRALPKVLEGTDPKEMIKRVGGGEELEARLRIALVGPRDETPDLAPPDPTQTAPVSTLPAVGEVFELTLEGTVDPIGMFRADGIDPKGWKHKGKKVKGGQTKKFKLVQIGYCSNWDAVLEGLKPHGGVPEGQWREAFKKAYPRPDGKGPVGVADASWVSPDGRRYFPYVHDDGEAWFALFNWPSLTSTTSGGSSSRSATSPRTLERLAPLDPLGFLSLGPARCIPAGPILF